MLAFQPHRYTRTRDCFEDFVRVLGTADAVLLTEVYAAGEPPLVAADGRALSRALRVAGKVEPVFVEDVAELPQAVLDFVRDGDVVIVMGAGSISRSRPKWENWHERAIRQGGCAVWRPFRRAGRVADVGRGRAAGAELGRR